MKGYYKKNNLQSEKSSKKKARMVIFTREDLKGTFDARGKISNFGQRDSLIFYQWLQLIKKFKHPFTAVCNMKRNQCSDGLPEWPILPTFIPRGHIKFVIILTISAMELLKAVDDSQNKGNIYDFQRFILHLIFTFFMGLEFVPVHENTEK